MGRVKREGINFSKGAIWNTASVFCIFECVQLPKGLAVVVVQIVSECYIPSETGDTETRY